MSSTSVGNNLNATSVSVGVAATLLAVARMGRESLLIENNSANILYVGGPSVVVGSAGTANSGIPVPAGQSITFDEFIGSLFGIASGAASDIRVLEIF